MARTLRPVRPNAGVRAKYRRRILRLLEETHRSVVWWLRAAYRRDLDRIVPETAQDASPAANLRKRLRELTRQWTSRWDEQAEDIVDMFMNETRTACEASLRQALKASGFTVTLPRSRVLNAAVRASIEWNVALIKSIGQEYLGQVESLVLRSATLGRDIPYLERELQKRFEVSGRRANFIARDQANKAHEAINRAECRELGATQAVWLHVPGKKTSRPTHQEMDRKIFDLDQGLYDEDEDAYVLPGELPGCACTSQIIIPEFGDAYDPRKERSA